MPRGPRDERGVLKAPVAALERDALLVKQPANGSQAFIRAAAALADRVPEKLVLEVEPARRGPERHARTSERREGAELLRENEWMPEAGDERRGAEPDPLGHRGCVAKCD